MKPSERRALRDKQNANIETEAYESIENKSDALQEYNEAAVTDIKKGNKKGKSILDDDVVSMRHEGFVQSHVRLITFIITLAVLLAVIGSFSIIRIIKLINENKNYEGMPMTVEVIKNIATKKAYIEWSDFDGYTYEDQSTDDTRVREYYVPNEGFTLIVRGDIKDKKYPDQVHFMYSNDKGTVFVDLRVGDINEFLRSVGGSDDTHTLTLDELYKLAKRGSNLTWADLEGCKYTQSQKVEGEVLYYVRTYRVAGASYSLVLEGKKISGKPEHATLINDATLESVDIKTGDIEEFLKDKEV